VPSAGNLHRDRIIGLFETVSSLSIAGLAPLLSDQHEQCRVGPYFRGNLLLPGCAGTDILLVAEHVINAELLAQRPAAYSASERR